MNIKLGKVLKYKAGLQSLKPYDPLIKWYTLGHVKICELLQRLINYAAQ